MVIGSQQVEGGVRYAPSDMPPSVRQSVINSSSMMDAARNSKKIGFVETTSPREGRASGGSFITQHESPSGKRGNGARATVVQMHPGPMSVDNRSGSHLSMKRQSTMMSRRSIHGSKAAREMSAGAATPASSPSAPTRKSLFQAPRDKYDGPIDILHRSTRQGLGIFIHNNGNSYAGEFKAGEFEGKGVYRWNAPTETVYEGEFNDGKPEGAGHFTSAEGNYYGGFFKGRMYGKGTYECHATQATYFGEHVEDQRQGRGKIAFQDGSSYEGTFVDNLPHGQGCYIWPDGTKYVGDIKDGQLNGWGELSDKDGPRYIGQWIDGVKHGWGWDKDKILKGEYQGAFVKGKRHGKGWFVFDNGVIYDGQWMEDHMEGKGIMWFAEGGKYDGNFKDGLFNNKGTLFDHDGTGGIEVGAWRDGKPVSIIRWVREPTGIVHTSLIESMNQAQTAFSRREITLDEGLRRVGMKRPPSFDD